MGTSGVVEIAKGIFWVGWGNQDGGLNCNSYLVVDGDEAVLIDPGSVLDFSYVYDNVCSIVPIENINYVVLHHQDPDFCSGVPLFEQNGANFKIVTHWRTQTLVKYYGIKSEYYIVNKNHFELTLNSGRKLSFIQTPYLHFAGAITTYDQTSKTLFSSDLFGAFSYKWRLYADQDYIEKMKAFHEHYMPSNDILRPVMEVFLIMDIEMIAPQHGSIIKDDVKKYIMTLRDLECGSFLTPIRKNLAKSGGYKFVCSTVLKRYASIFNRNEVEEAVKGMDLTLNSDLQITDYNYPGKDLWNLMFEKVLAQKGLSWLLVIEPLVQSLAKEYDLPIPMVFDANLKKAEEKATNLSKENLLLKSSNERLAKSLSEAEYQLTRCSVTGLYNFSFFASYLSKEILGVLSENSEQNPGLMIISIDKIANFAYSYGTDEVNELLKNVVYIFESLRAENEIYFRLHDYNFACYIPDTTQDKAIAFSEKIRNTIALSGKFIQPITVSVGVVCLDELREEIKYINSPDTAFYNTAKVRVRHAITMGMNIVCSNSPADVSQGSKSVKILLADTDAVNIDVLKTFLESLDYEVLTVSDGEAVLRAAEESHPDLIISEIMLPKTDGFLVREKLLSKSETKNIPFFIVSYLKDEDSVQRAINIGIDHYFKKPFMLSELLGTIKNKLKEDAI